MIRALCMLTLALGLAAGEARAEWSSGKGAFIFGPEMSEHEACQRADRRAQEKAVAGVSGERLFSEDMVSCSERKDAAGCLLKRHTWSVIDGEIQGVRNKKVSTKDLGNGTRECSVSLEADVRMGSGRPDPGFDMSIDLNRSVFRHGELLEISIDPTQAMYLTVFQWLPYEAAERQVMRIFPNEYDRQNYHEGRVVIPTPARTEDYDFEVKFPEKVDYEDKSVDEFLMIVGTREKIRFRYSYSLREFRSRLLELPRDQWRQVKRAITVVRDE